MQARGREGRQAAAAFREQAGLQLTVLAGAPSGGSTLASGWQDADLQELRQPFLSLAQQQTEHPPTHSTAPTHLSVGSTPRAVRAARGTL